MKARKPRDPNWLVEEMILASDVLQEHGWDKTYRKTSNEANLLSQLLNRANFHPKEVRSEKFRSPKAANAKINNLQAHHPEKPNEGPRQAVGEAPIVQAFVEDPQAMRSVAAEIRRRIDQGTEYAGLATEILQDHLWTAERDASSISEFASLVEASEGDAKIILSLRRERDPKLRKAKIQEVARHGQRLVCEVCDFDFETTYGDRGEGYIEVHHRVPLHISGTTMTRLDDLALLCSNCHRMVHRKGWISTDELMGMVREQQAHPRMSLEACVRE